jgi:hypothetical protein
MPPRMDNSPRRPLWAGPAKPASFIVPVANRTVVVEGEKRPPTRYAIACLLAGISSASKDRTMRGHRRTGMGMGA